MPVEVCILCVTIPDKRSERGRGTCNVERKRARQERDERAWEPRSETLELWTPDTAHNFQKGSCGERKRGFVIRNFEVQRYF
jgi:hypothetical protein